MGAAASSGFRARVALPALMVGTALVLGEAIQSPGLAVHLAWNDGYAPESYGIRLPIFQLALEPLFTVLLLAEFAKLLLPDRALRILAVPARRRAGTAMVAALALLVALGSSWSIHREYAALGLMIGEGHRAAGTASLVGGVALLIWLADRIRLAEFEHAGFWLVVSAFTAAILPTDLENWVEVHRFGPPVSRLFERTLALAALGVALVVLVAGALRLSVRRAGADLRVWSPLLIWPPFLATALADALTRLAAAAGLGDPAQAAHHATLSDTSRLVAAASLAILTPLVILLQARSIARLHPEQAHWEGKGPVLCALALVQAGVLSAVVLVQGSFLLQSGAAYIALVTVAWALWCEARPGGGRPAG